VHSRALLRLLEPLPRNAAAWAAFYHAALRDCKIEDEQCRQAAYKTLLAAGGAAVKAQISEQARLADSVVFHWLPFCALLCGPAADDAGDGSCGGANCRIALGLELDSICSDSPYGARKAPSNNAAQPPPEGPAAPPPAPAPGNGSSSPATAAREGVAWMVAAALLLMSLI
jgi:hypothetical protein